MGEDAIYLFFDKNVLLPSISLEENNGNLAGLEECDLAKLSSKSDLYSPILHLEVSVLSPDVFGDDNYKFCSMDGRRYLPVIDLTRNLFEIRFSKLFMTLSMSISLSSAADFFIDIRNRKWECAILSHYACDSHLMLIEWHETTVERIGQLQIMFFSGRCSPCRTAKDSATIVPSHRGRPIPPVNEEGNE
jgi:hypothetical protein